uniref:Uncharacterized protein n=1 Tax=Candidatus Kentrum sp. TUN TaxID=2126343 RepID=A0A450ZRT9_9GAMM|nr:MAG: hypothetical protein BECKTUN1418F_GA0071002_10907 [Candidatus Kentron sp. TUN]VFK62881.1 MAG: hypothetical protein BECKTUN1418E_GA0071001_10888 [Candidatus Kentron sp. TUN]
MKLQQITPIISATAVSILAFVGIINSDRLVIMAKRIAEEITPPYDGNIHMFALGLLLAFATIYFLKEI